MKHAITAVAFMLAAGYAAAQCTADFDFGTAAWGASPDASIGEQFDTAYVNVDYNDVFHVLVPVDASEIDPAFQLPLDSIILVDATLIADSGAGATLSFEDVGLEIVCNNNGVSPNPCTFVGGGQYCAELTGVPNQGGLFAMTLEVQAWVTVFGVAVPQPYLFDGFTLTVIGPNSIEEAQNMRFTMYPNPSANLVQVELPAGERTNRLVVRDLMGRTVHAVNAVNQDRLTLDVATWSDGVYFVALEGANSQWTERLVVRH